MSTTTTTALKDILAYSSASEGQVSPAGNAVETESDAARIAGSDSVGELSPHEVDSLLDSSVTGRYLLDSRGLLPVPEIDRESEGALSVPLAADDDEDALKAARGVMVALACTALLWGLIYAIARVL